MGNDLLVALSAVAFVFLYIDAVLFYSLINSLIYLIGYKPEKPKKEIIAHVLISFLSFVWLTLLNYMALPLFEVIFFLSCKKMGLK